MTNFFTNSVRIFLLLIACCCTINLSAQQLRTIKLHEGDAQVTMMTHQDLVQKEINKGKWNDKYYSLIYYDRKPDHKHLKFLKNIGAEVIESLSENFLMVRFRNIPSPDYLSNAGIKGVGQMPGNDKISKKLKDVLTTGDSQELVRVSILLHTKENPALVQDQLSQLGFIPFKKYFTNRGLFTGDIPKNKISVVADFPCVKYVGLYDYESHPLLFRENRALGIQNISSTAYGMGLSGSGVTIGIGDDADPTSHIDNRINNFNRSPAPLNFSGHGTAVTGIVSSDGIIDERFTGVAPLATTVTDFFDLVIGKTELYAKDFGMTVTNNSYYIGFARCPGNGEYNELSAYADDQILSMDTLQHIFAAGNDGSFSCSPYPSGFGTIKSGYQTAKNVLTVGDYTFAELPRVISTNSSRGPVYDGRLKPEIVAPGSAVFSTGLNNTYNGQNWGTSFAAPFVAGCWALLTEQYRKKHNGKTPSSGLLKAILCNTASDKGNQGPDYTYGFGLLNPKRAVNIVDLKQHITDSVTDGENKTYSIKVPAGIKEVKLMLYWHDVTGTPLSQKALQNDLDLSVADGSDNYLPWVLNGIPAGVNNPAIRAIDRINNIEQITINNPGTDLTLTVSGNTVISGTQRFYLTWDFISQDLLIIRPAGGERFTAGASNETISWDVTDNSDDSLSIEYSLDNGQSWTFVSNTNTARMFTSWAVPANIATTKAKIRLKRISDGATAVTPGVFTIIGLPQLTANIVCDGAVDLSWPSISNVTDYEVLQLIDNKWTRIAITSQNTYPVRKLNKLTAYWFTVRARIEGEFGRRAVAVNVTPKLDAPCLNDEFNNNLVADSLISPKNARQFTSTTPGNAESVTVRIKNLDNTDSPGSFELSYQINGGIITKEQVNQAIPAGGTFDYTFVTKANLSLPGNYNIRVWVKQPGDNTITNDTSLFLVKHLANPPLILPFSEGFETVGENEYLGNIFGLKDLNRFDLTMSTGNGRARTFVNTGVAPEGSKAISLDAAQFLGDININQLTGTFNLSNNSSSEGVRLDFLYRNQGQLKLPNSALWIRGGDIYEWIKAYEFDNNQKQLGDIRRGWVNISDLLNQAGQPLTSSFQVKLEQSGRTSTNNAIYYTDLFDLDDGLTFDLLRISNASNDLILDSVLSPEVVSCSGQIAQQTVRIRIKNTSNAVLTNIPVSYRIDNGTVVTENIPSVGANTTLNYTFSTPLVLNAFGNYQLNVWIKHPSDTYSLNDSITAYDFTISKEIAGFPYLESFENDNGGWYTDGGLYNSWVWGTANPSARAVLREAAYGNKAWFTSLNGTYRPNELSYLYSPCFDISGLSDPMLSFSHIFQQERGRDFHLLEYSTNNGRTWQRLGANGDGFNWYDTTANFWNKNFERWHVTSAALPDGISKIRFRFLLSSDEFSQLEGIGIDDFHLFEKQTIYEGKNASINANVSGQQFTDFKVQGQLVASIHPLGQDLGNVNVNVYINSDSDRYLKNQYYLDRNFVIKSQSEPKDSVLIRLYFSENDLIRMLEDSICKSCFKLKDAYGAVVTKYNGLDPFENNILNDGTFGSFHFIDASKVKIAPFNNGYYAEFKVNSFSEFWIHVSDFKLRQTPITNISDSVNTQTFIKNAMVDQTGQLQIFTGSQNNINEMQVFLFNSNGQNIYSGRHPYRFTDIGLRHIASGVYFLIITDRTGKYKYRQKLIRP